MSDRARYCVGKKPLKRWEVHDSVLDDDHEEWLTPSSNVRQRFPQTHLQHLILPPAQHAVTRQQHWLEHSCTTAAYTMQQHMRLTHCNHWRYKGQVKLIWIHVFHWVFETLAMLNCHSSGLVLHLGKLMDNGSFALNGMFQRVPWHYFKKCCWCFVVPALDLSRE